MTKIETPEDLAEWLADQADVYGGCRGITEDNAQGPCPDDVWCRVCWVPDVADRIYRAVENAKKLKEAGLS